MKKLETITFRFPNEFNLKGTVNIQPNEIITVISDNIQDLTPLLNLLYTFYAFGADYFKEGKLSGQDVAEKMKDQLGELEVKNVIYKEVWPHSVNFGELCYSSDPTVNLEITWRFRSFQDLLSDT